MPTLIQVLTQAGAGSRRQCFRLITLGKVQVNGQVVLAASAPVDPEKDEVRVEGRRVEAGRRVYLKLNKPKGVVSTTSDERGRPTVVDLLPPPYRDVRLYPVGRLDADTMGLLLLTNDGDLAYRLTHPRFQVEKEYHALLDGPLTLAQRRALERGVMVEGRRTAPARVRRLPGSDEPRYSITLHEGRKRQVRRMLRAVGRTVLELERVRMHTLRLGDLPPAAVQELSPQELASLRLGLPEGTR